MELNISLTIAHSLANSGIITKKNISDAVEVQKSFKQNGFHFPLCQILLHSCMTDSEAAEKYLQCLVQQVEIPEIREVLDPYGMELSPHWNSQLDAVAQSMTNEEKAEMQLMQQELAKMETTLAIPHLFLLKMAKPKMVWPEMYAPSKDKKINLDYLCQRKRKKELLFPNSKIAKLSGGLLSMEDIEKSLMVQKEISQNKHIQIPVFHLLIARHSIEPYLLHALTLAQFDWQPDGLECWLGGMCIQKVPVNASLKPQILAAKKACCEFLESQFLFKWLTYDPSEEYLLIEYLNKNLDKDAIAQNKKIQQDLEQKGVTLSLVNILCVRRVVPISKLIEGVLTVLYKMPSDQVAKIVKTIEEAEAREKANASKEEETEQESVQENKTVPEKQADREKEKPKKLLSTTMAVSKKHLDQKLVQPKPSTEAGSKIIERLERLKKAKASQDVQSEKEQEAGQKKPEEPAQEEKANVNVQPTVQTITVSLTEEMVRIKEALQQKILSQDDIIAGFMELQKGGGEGNLLNILHERGSLKEQAYNDLKAKAATATQIKIPKSSNDIDLALAGLLTEYKLLARDQLQTVLRLQNYLNSLEISLTLDTLIVKTKTMAQEMIQPLIIECRRRKEAKSQPNVLGQTMRVDTRATKPESKQSFPTLKETMRLELGKKVEEPKLAEHLPPWIKMLTPLRVAATLLALSLCLAMWAFLGPQKKSRIVSYVQPENATQPNITEPKPPVEKETPKNPTTEEPGRTAPSEPSEKWGIYEIKKTGQTIAKPVAQKAVIFLTSLKNVQISIEAGDIVVRGLLDIPDLPKSGVNIAFTIWDYTKTGKTQSKIFPCTGEFEWRIPNLLEQIMAGFYYVQLSISSESQNPETLSCLQLTMPYEWWFPFYKGNKGEIQNYVNQYFSNSANLVKKMKALHGEMVSLRKTPWAKAKKEWDGWSKKWQKEYQTVINSLENEKKSSLLVFNGKISNEAESISKHLLSTFSELEKWAQGITLIPPDISETDERQKSLDRLNAFIAQEQKNVSQQIALLFKRT